MTEKTERPSLRIYSSGVLIQESPAKPVRTSRMYQSGLEYHPRPSRRQESRRRKWASNPHILSQSLMLKQVPPARPLKVLIAEDDEFSVLPIASTLDKRNIPYDLAKNGSMVLSRYLETIESGYSAR